MCNCRCCGKVLTKDPFLKYSNMPKSAQYFPDETNVNEEQGVDIIIHQCKYCGLVQVTGQPVSYYKDVIRATAVSDEMRIYRENQYRKFVNKYNLENKKIIEIGCGRGEYMSFMEGSANNVYGLEHSETSVITAKNNGHNVYQGFLENEEYIIPNAPYDCFYIMSFLEHIPNPRDFLNCIYNNLNYDAVGIVEVPNFDMILSDNLYAEFIQDHLCYFTKRTLSLLLELSGFEVLSCEPVWHDYILSAVVRKRQLYSKEQFDNKYETHKKNVCEYLEKKKKKGKKIATWGAGHQALAYLSLLNMDQYIEFVIDSAKFKQNKYTPATHLPIVAPDRLQKGEIDIIVIMAASYSQEVKGIINREYPSIECVILGEDEIII